MVKQAPKMYNLYCEIVKLFILVVASCAKTDWIKLRVSYSITSRHLQRPDLLHNRQGHPTGIIEKNTWKQQQSMINAFWSHFTHFGRLLGKSYRFLTPSKTDGRVLSQQSVPTPCNLTYWEVSQQKRRLSGHYWPVWLWWEGGTFPLTNNTFQLFYNSTHFSPASLSFQGHIISSQPDHWVLQDSLDS